MPRYLIADIIVDVKTNNKYILDRMKPFLTVDADMPDLSIIIRQATNIQPLEGDIIINEDMRWIAKKPPKAGFYGHTFINDNKTVIADIDSDKDWKNTRVSYIKNVIVAPNQTNPTDILAFLFAGIGFRHQILHKDGITIHASSIDSDGKGIIFTAPSGTGKSTHVSLWEKNKKDVKILNDDNPVLRLNDRSAYIYGTPWSGSSDKFMNGRAPLSAIVVLQQAPENSITQLSLVEAIPSLMPRLFLPYIDKQLMEKALTTFEKIVSSTSVYLLKCRPDREAFEMVYQCVK